MAEARAGVLKNRPLREGEWTAAAEPLLAVDDSNVDFTFFAHAGYGVWRGLGLHVKGGKGKSFFNDHAVYLGGSVDLPVVLQEEGWPGLFVSLGGSNWQRGTFEAQAIFYKSLAPLGIYLGPGAALSWTAERRRYPTQMIFGALIEAGPLWAVFVEGGVGVHQAADDLSAGLRFYWPPPASASP